MKSETKSEDKSLEINTSFEKSQLGSNDEETPNYSAKNAKETMNSQELLSLTVHDVLPRQCFLNKEEIINDIISNLAQTKVNDDNVLKTSTGIPNENLLASNDNDTNRFEFDDNLNNQEYTIEVPLLNRSTSNISNSKPPTNVINFCRDIIPAKLCSPILEEPEPFDEIETSSQINITSQKDKLDSMTLREEETHEGTTSRPVFSILDVDKLCQRGVAVSRGLNSNHGSNSLCSPSLKSSRADDAPNQQLNGQYSIDSLSIDYLTPSTAHIESPTNYTAILNTSQKLSYEKKNLNNTVSSSAENENYYKSSSLLKSVHNKSEKNESENINCESRTKFSNTVNFSDKVISVLDNIELSPKMVARTSPSENKNTQCPDDLRPVVSSSQGKLSEDCELPKEADTENFHIQSNLNELSAANTSMTIEKPENVLSCRTLNTDDIIDPVGTTDNISVQNIIGGTQNEEKIEPFSLYENNCANVENKQILNEIINSSNSEINDEVSSNFISEIKSKETRPTINSSETDHALGVVNDQNLDCNETISSDIDLENIISKLDHESFLTSNLLTSDEGKFNLYIFCLKKTFFQIISYNI